MKKKVICYQLKLVTNYAEANWEATESETSFYSTSWLVFTSW